MSRISKRIYLPRGGQYCGRHPFLVELERWKERTGHSQAAFADSLGITPASVAEWVRSCRENRDHKLPADRMWDVCTLLDVHPSVFRPDLWDSKAQRPQKVFQ